MPMNWKLDVGTPTTLISGLASSVTTSFGGRSWTISASPRTSEAMRDSGAGTVCHNTRLIAGRGPLFHSSKRAKTMRSPIAARSILKAPPPAGLVFSHSMAKGSSAVACWLASFELTMMG